MGSGLVHDLGNICPDAATPTAVGESDLLTMQLGGADVDAVPVFDIPLSGLANAESTGLEEIALGAARCEASTSRTRHCAASPFAASPKAASPPSERDHRLRRIPRALLDRRVQYFDAR